MGVGAHPFGTVATEELLFRGLLTAVTERAFPPAGATAIRAVTFGLWHVHPAHVADDSVPGTVAFTAAASLVFDWLRARSGSLLAPRCCTWPSMPAARCCCAASR